MRLLLLMIPLLVFGCGEGPFGGKEKVRVKATTGQPGVDGEPGGVGPAGEKGDTGQDGSTGSTGDQGETGAPGDKGDDGSQGSEGEQGNPGQNTTVTETETEVIFRGGDGTEVVWVKPPIRIITVCWCDKWGTVHQETGEAVDLLVYFFGDPHVWIGRDVGDCTRMRGGKQ